MPYGRFDIDVNAAMGLRGREAQRQRFPGGRRDGYPDGGTRAGRHLMTELMIRGRTDDVLCVPVDPPRLRELGMGTSRRMKLTDSSRV